MEQQERYRLRVSYRKFSTLTLISHRSLIDVLMRAIRRTKVPLRFTEGFSPRPKVIFTPPLPLGVTGENELIDIETTMFIEGDELTESLNSGVPEGLKFLKATNLLKGAPGLNKMIDGADYSFQPCQSTYTARVNEILSSEELIIEKRGKKGKPAREIDVKPFIRKIVENEDGSVDTRIAAGDKTVSPLILASLIWPELEANVLENVIITRKGFISPSGVKLY